MKIYYLIRSIGTFISYLLLFHKQAHKSQEAIRVWQFKQLKALIQYAWEHIPFYRKYWEQAGFSPSQFHSLEDMELIPFIDKNTVREHREEMLNPTYAKNRLSLVTTGGTTGMPLQFYIDNFVARAKELAFGYWYGKHYWGYLDRIHKIAVLRGARIDEDKIKHRIFWQKSTRDHGLVFSSFHITEENYTLYLSKLRDYKPRFIKAYPSSIVAFCTLMKRHGDYGLEGLRGVICSSENVYESHRKLICETLGVEIYSYYGHSEKAVAACQDGHRMVFQPCYGYTEFINDEGKKTVRRGEIAQVVATSLGNYYFPFIRYKTNDLIEVDDAEASIAKRILGRAQEFVIDKDGNKVIFTCADEIFWELKGIVAYQYVQEEQGKLGLYLQVDRDFSQSTLQVVRDAVQQMFFNFEIKVSIVERIEKTKAGKFRYLIQGLDL